MKKSIVIIASILAIASFTSCKCMQKKNKTTEEKIEQKIKHSAKKPEAYRLNGTIWQLERVDAQKRDFVPTEKNEKITLSFSDNRMNTSDGCNAITANYTQRNYGISFSMFASTRMYCDKAYMEKNGYSVPFENVVEYWVENNEKLFLLDKNGDKIATYKKIK